MLLCEKETRKSRKGDSSTTVEVLSSSSHTPSLWLLGQARLLRAAEGAPLADSTALPGADQLRRRRKSRR